MRINQLYSNFGYYFREAATSKFNLIPYTDVYQPMLMVGCYNHQQLAVSLNHKSLCVIYWGGSDAQALVKAGKDNFWSDQFRQRKNIKHIAASHWIKEDLDLLGIENYFLPISLFNNSSLSACKLGDSVYMYNAESPIYNGGIYQQIKESLPGINFIETTVKSYPVRSDLIEVYKRCFVGLRFTAHDGLSETAIEMGLLGRPMIHNGDLPNCIPYGEDVKEIVQRIKFLHSNRDDWSNEDVSKNVRKFLYHSEDWLDTDFYSDVRKDATCSGCTSDCGKCDILGFN